jgi:hypothetical protein
MLKSPTDLRDKLIELDNDVGLLGGRKVALLGFRDPNAKRVQENVLRLSEANGWKLVDVDAVHSAQLAMVLAEALSAPKLVLLIDVAAPIPTDVSLLIRALHDSQDAVVWEDRTLSQLPEERILYVIALGARSSDELPPLLQRIDFMTFVRSPQSPCT